MRIIIFLLTVLCAYSSILAQIPAIRNFGPRDYNGGTQNWCIEESAGKYMFVANTVGLMVFDGNNWTTGWTPNHTTVHGVIFKEKSNRIYIGAFEEFGYFKNLPPLNKSPYISLSSHIPDKYKVGTDIWGLYEMPDGSIIFRSNYYLFTYNEVRNSLYINTLPDKTTNISVIGGKVYVTTEKSIYSFDGKKLIRLNSGFEKKSGYICGGFADPYDNRPVFVTRNGNFLKLTGQKIHTHTIPQISNSVSGKNIFCVSESDKKIAFGTIDKGLVIYDKEKNTVLTLDRANGLRNNTVLGLHTDSDGNLWAALDNGLSYIMFDSPFRTILSDNESVGTGYASYPLGDRLYLGTNQGLYNVQLPGKNPISSFTPVKVEGISGQIWTLADAGDRLLCGADVGAFEIIGNKAIPIPGIKGTWGFRRVPGRQDYWIASHYNGIALLKKIGNKFVFLHNIEGTNECSVNFEIGNDGLIWYSHWLQGVYCLKTDSDLRRVEKQTVYNAGNQLERDDNHLVTKINNRIYLCANNGYFTRNSSDGKLEKAEWLCRLFPTNNITTRLLETPQGNIWGYRPGHLSYASRSGNKFVKRSIHYKSMVNRLQMNLGNPSFLADGRTIMNQEEGVFVVDPSYPEPEFRDVYINNVLSVNDGPDSPKGFLYRALGLNIPTEFKAEPGKNSLYFDFSLPEYRDERGVTYSTFVKGYDKDWTEPQPESFRRLDNLPPGKYVMQIKAFDTILGNTATTDISFQVCPRWYQTWWAKTLGLLIMAIIIYFCVDAVKHRIESTIERRRLTEERRRIEEEEKNTLKESHERLMENNRYLNEEIKRKTGELAGTDINLQRKTDVLNDIRASLDNIMAIPPGRVDDIRGAISRLKCSLNFHTSEDSNWENMQENFNIIFDNFLKKLMLRYPQLTRNDLRICSYLRMNMSTKEIASLMNVSERSVESNRYRLRKRLGMVSGQSFQDFFNNIDNE